ncbi:hypothetical protein DICPUDRAFT_56354 [Dictyostelium purpureum]|uniref:Rho-GAP domain-containing protein n=1 Tax=Dictyostelium purpureum TaxID=5786 RepID=F0ZR11_DICPU|nr:uncharacterized protein DICPUDRAFT_56354 [Dictyostelium purpureum]EGC33638.1 hypothetical protein DICPUDRAFT_56354 [Dictyostelium purpureum]|eukprot:XP_003289858.1 hypothetical protein DICPUDRAFT_56354 [Dictyostelium purpureum]
MAPDGYIGPKLKNTWEQIRLETLAHSNHHENIGSNISTHIIEPIEGLIVDLEQKLKVIHIDAEKIFTLYQESVMKLKKAKQNYDRLCKDSFEITGVTKGETQKVQKRAIKAAQDVIKADKEYRGQINETNNSQKLFLSEQIPKIMNDLQRLEMVRIHMVKTYFLRYFKSLEATPQKFNTETENLLALISGINNEDEIQDFVRKSKTTHKYPKPFEYEPYLDRFSQHSQQPSPQISSPQLLSPRDAPYFNNNFNTITQAQQTAPNHISNSLSLSSENIHNTSTGSTSSSGGSGSNNNTPTKEKKPGVWNLKRFSSSISNSDRKLLNKQIQSIGLAHNGGNVFGCKIEDIMFNQKKKYPLLEVPFIIVFLKQKLISLDVYKTQGIFRVPGNVVDINSLKKRFDEGNYEVGTNENVYTVASLLKLWLREITEPLFPPTTYEQCIATTKKEQVCELVASLPLLNQKIIGYIIEFLQEAIKPEYVETSKMGSDNLAMVFSPCFLRSPHTDPNILLGNIFKEKEFVKNLIEGLVPLEVCDSLEGPSAVTISVNQLNKAVKPLVGTSSSPMKSGTENVPQSPSNTNNNNGTPTKLTTPSITQQNLQQKSLSTPLPSIKPFNNIMLSPIIETSPNKQHPPLSLSTSSLSSSTTSMPASNISSSFSSASTSLSSSTGEIMSPPQHPKISQIKGEENSTPIKSGNGEKVPVHLMSPSEVKRRSDHRYLENQEKVKEMIDEIHTQLNELYSDITTIESTSYFAMQSSLAITKFTKSLETFLTLDMWTLTLPEIKDQIEKNKFVSPPPLNFKIPSKLPKLTPTELASNQSSIDLLRQWLINITLTVNRANEYLCYLGGVVIRIYSPESIRLIQNLFVDINLRPSVDSSNKFANLTLEQATVFIQKTISLLGPLNPFTEEELNINTKVLETVTPASFSPALLSEQDSLSGSPINLDGVNSISSSGNTKEGSSHPTQFNFSEDNHSTNNSGSNLSINSTNSTKMMDDFDDDIIDFNSKLKIEEENKKQLQEYRQLIIDIVSDLKDKKKLLNQCSESDDSQVNIRSIAKYCLTLKRELDTFINENDLSNQIENEIDPIINKDNDSFTNLKIMTNHFIGRISFILATIKNNSEFNPKLFELLLNYK